MTPWVKRLIAANVVMFFLSGMFPNVTRLLVLYPPALVVRPWTAVTYMFLHAGLFHLLFNMLGLFFFGPQLETRLGAKRFLSLYVLSGLGGAAFSFLFARSAPVIGASAGVFGVFLAFARFWPRAQIYIWGVLPVQARWLVAFMTVLALWGGVGGAQPGVAHFAHLGGFAAGWAYLKWIETRSPQRRFERKLYGEARRPADEDDVRRWERIRRDDLHEVNRDELDRLLAKISQSGAQSLTVEERAFLNRFTSH